NAAAAAEVGLRAPQSALIFRERFERRLRFHFLVEEELRHRLERLHFRKSLVRRRENLAENERRVNAVAGRVHGEIDDVARLLAADDRIIREHLFEYVLVADV